MPWIGSTSMFGMLRAAAAKPLCTSAPSMISALVRPRPEKWPIRALVLAASSLAASMTTRSPSLAVPESQRAYLLRQVGGMRAYHRAKGTAAAAELRHAGRAMASATRTLLLVHLLAGAPDLGATLGLVRAGLALVELPLHAAGNDVLARLETEDLVRQVDRARGLALEGCDFQFHLTRPPSQAPLPQPARRPRP